MSDIDITSDLTGGADDGALGDRPYNGQSADAQPNLPAGVQPAHGRDAVHVNRVDVNTNAAPQQPKQELSLREQLSSAFQDQNGKPAAQDKAPTAKPADTPAKPVETPATLTKDSSGKYRLADGTFASDAQVQAFEASQQAAPANAQQQSPVLARLTAQEAQQFQSLPAELRQYVERTMEGLDTRAARYSEYEQLEQLIGPRRQAFAAQGGNMYGALNQLFALSDFAGRDPGAFAMWFAQQHNLDLDALQDARDAAEANVSPEVRELRGQVQQLSGQVQQFQQNGQNAVHQSNLSDVQSFASERDAAGAFMRPYLTDVMDGWTAQITALRSSDPNMPNAEVLQKAYENACWLDPTVRGKMQTAAQDAERATAQARVDAAKRAGSSVTGAPVGESSTIPNNSNRTLREELDAAFAAARAV